MATPKFNSKSPTIKRILREAAELATSPSPFFHATPSTDADLFDWHFTLLGPPSSPFSSGIYHGRIILPPSYPLRPPSFRFLTPSGRFEVNREICLSISGHHEETWMPAWGVRTALTALRSFMETDAKGQLGGVDASKEERERCAKASGEWTCSGCGRSNGVIMSEQQLAAREAGNEEEAKVPEELRMAYKDQLSPLKPADEEKHSESEDEDAQLAEGFVRTGLDGADDSQPTSPPAATYPPARPAQGVPQPTATLRAPVPSADGILTGMPHRVVNTPVPIWIDRAIGAIIVCLVALVLKVLLGL